jgi:hypothetical protein
MSQLNLCFHLLIMTRDRLLMKLSLSFRRFLTTLTCCRGGMGNRNRCISCISSSCEDPQKLPHPPPHSPHCHCHCHDPHRELWLWRWLLCVWSERFWNAISKSATVGVWTALERSINFNQMRLIILPKDGFQLSREDRIFVIRQWRSTRLLLRRRELSWAMDPRSVPVESHQSQC